MHYFEANRNLFRAALLLILISLQNSVGLARQNRWTHFGLRPLAMGNAFVAVADDKNAMFYNPAGLARRKKNRFGVVSPTVQVGKNTMSLLSDITKLGASDLEVSKLLELMEENAGRPMFFSTGVSPYAYWPGIGFAIGLHQRAGFVLHNNIAMDVDLGVELLAPISYARNFFEDRLSVGGSLKFVAFGGVGGEFDIDSLTALSSDDGGQKIEDKLQGGTGVGLDFGLLYTPVDQYEPTLGLSITDFGGTSFSKPDSDNLSAPTTRAMSINTGVSFKPYSDEKMYVRVSCDAHSINRPIHYSHKLHFGLEYGYLDIAKVQAGLKDGYLTGGVEIDANLLELRLATYFVDHAPVVGTHEGLLEQRYAFEVKLLI